MFWENLKKFTLKYSDLPTIMWNLRVLLRVATINIDENYDKPTPVIFYLLMAAGVGSYSYIYIFSVFWFVFLRCETMDPVLSSVGLSIGLCSVTCLIKFLHIKIHAKSIRSLVIKYLECDRLVTPGTRYSCNLRKALRVVKKRATKIYLIIVTNALSAMIIAAASPGRHFHQDLFILYALDPMTETPNYEIATALYDTAICFATYILVSVGAFLVITLGYVEAHLITLSSEIDNLWGDSQKYYEDLKRNENILADKDIVVNTYINEQLKDCVRFHVMNIELLNSFEKHFKDIKILEFTCMSFAVIAELLGGLENTYIQIPYTFVQLFIDCLAGQKLIDANIKFERALYESKWENFNVANQKLILQMLQNSQKTLMISVGGPLKLNYACFLAVVKTTYSAYTALKPVMK